MEYKILLWNLGNSIAVELKDGRTAVVDVMSEIAFFEEVGNICTHGMWEEWEGDLDPEARKTVDRLVGDLIK